ncbi:MAG: adenosylcobinamide-phosphate synthase CbiB [Lachnospiraceae bacterium]|nr:adenosylcobinamide-phosphate synthase CbiB [Lachnospiraceae bacterium]
MTDRMIIIFAAFVLDLILGDPAWRFHPVRGMGMLIYNAEKALRTCLRINPQPEAQRVRKRIAGVLLVIITIAVSTAAAAFIIYMAESINHYLRVAVEIWLCYRLLAMKSLRTESMKVFEALESGDLERSRKAVSMIVGRDTEELTCEGVTRAAVETVAENTTDAVTAPLIYMLIFGALGGFLYKALNTMDSMVGYKNDKYKYFGTAAARLDDIASFLPARISACAMIAASFILKLNYKNAAKIFKRDRYKHKSPNSAQTEAVCAGALGIELGGDAFYFGRLVKKPVIGDALRPVKAEDIRRANCLMYVTGGIVFVLGECALLAFSLCVI